MGGRDREGEGEGGQPPPPPLTLNREGMFAARTPGGRVPCAGGRAARGAEGEQGNRERMFRGGMGGREG